MSELMNEIKRAAVGDGKYAGLPSHVYSLFGDALAKLDEVAAPEARLSKMEGIETESAAVIAMARSFANFPSWLEKLEAALADDDLSKLTTQQKPDMESMLRASPSCGMDGCLWEREEMRSPVDPD